MPRKRGRATKIGSAYLDLRVRTGQFRTDLGRAEDRARKTSATFGRLGPQIAGQLGTSIGGLGPALGAIGPAGLGAAAAIGGVALAIGGAARAGLSAVRSFAGVEVALSRIVGLVGVAQQQVDAWGSDINALSGELGRAPRKLAEGLFFITSAGLRGAEAMEVLRASGMAAVGGLGEIATVADAATSAMNAYGTEVVSAMHATDVLVATVREGKLSADELAGSIGRVLPLAAQMGVQFHEVGAVLASLTRIGLGTDEAVTSLQALLSGLLKVTPAAEKALARYGLSAAKLRDIVRKQGLVAALDLLTTTIEGNEVVLGEILPNVRALRGALGLMGENADTTEAILAAMADTAGSTATAFGAAANTIQGRWDRVRGTFQGIWVEVGRELSEEIALPALEGLTAWLDANRQTILQGVSNWEDVFAMFGEHVQETLAAVFSPQTMGQMVLASLRTAGQQLERVNDVLVSVFEGLSATAAAAMANLGDIIWTRLTGEVEDALAGMGRVFGDALRKTLEAAIALVPAPLRRLIGIEPGATMLLPAAAPGGGERRAARDDALAGRTSARMAAATARFERAAAALGDFAVGATPVAVAGNLELPHLERLWQEQRADWQALTAEWAEAATAEQAPADAPAAAAGDQSDAASPVQDAARSPAELLAKQERIVVQLARVASKRLAAESEAWKRFHAASESGEPSRAALLEALAASREARFHEEIAALAAQQVFPEDPTFLAETEALKRVTPPPFPDIFARGPSAFAVEQEAWLQASRELLDEQAAAFAAWQDDIDRQAREGPIIASEITDSLDELRAGFGRQIKAHLASQPLPRAPQGPPPGVRGEQIPEWWMAEQTARQREAARQAPEPSTFDTAAAQMVNAVLIPLRGAAHAFNAVFGREPMMAAAAGASHAADAFERVSQELEDSRIPQRIGEGIAAAAELLETSHFPAAMASIRDSFARADLGGLVNQVVGPAVQGIKVWQRKLTEANPLEFAASGAQMLMEGATAWVDQVLALDMAGFFAGVIKPAGGVLNAGVSRLIDALIGKVDEETGKRDLTTGVIGSSAPGLADFGGAVGGLAAMGGIPLGALTGEFDTFLASVGNLTGQTGLAAQAMAFLGPAAFALGPIFTSMMSVLQPLIMTALRPLLGILGMIGKFLGGVLAPAFHILGVATKLVGSIFAWLYNNVLIHLGNALITLYNGIIKVYNFLLGWLLGRAEEAELLKNLVVDAEGEKLLKGAGAPSADSGATFEQQRPIEINIDIHDNEIAGDGSFRDLAIAIRQELETLDAIRG